MADEVKAAAWAYELPAAFVEEMKELFETMPGVSVSELQAFLESFRKERSYGLRRNPLKFTKEEFLEKMPFSLEDVPWAEEGYFYNKEEQPGKSPWHETGAFYIQEPSAMIAAELLGGKPGEYIADLCAAPGGKSTQIAGKMQGEGLIVCNEYVSARADILAQNMERMGVFDCVILQESVERIAARFPLFFDRVLVDAPCSGEGMFRKEEQALMQWSPENVMMCARRQQEILEDAARIVKPGGVLIYSTCTFSEAENEAVIGRFLETHEEFYADETVLSEALILAGVCPGKIHGTVRMWPHKVRGEGHFAARLIRKAGGGSGMILQNPDRNNIRKNRISKREEADSTKENDRLFDEFCHSYLHKEYTEKLENSGNFLWKNEHLFLVPKGLPEMGGLRVKRCGLHLGEAKKGRFEPSHTWAMTLKKEDVLQCMEVKEVTAYLCGETQENEGFKGWVLMLFEGKPIGFGKAAGAVVKNHYPKGLRIHSYLRR